MKTVEKVGAKNFIQRYTVLQSLQLIKYKLLKNW